MSTDQASKRIKSVQNILFYKQLAALSKDRHSDLYVDNQSGYLFAKATNSVFIGAGEFKAVAPEYPIVFLPEGKNVVPVAVLGLERNENTFVTAEGEWLGRYIPAYIRRYPFIPVQVSSDELVLCIDEQAQDLNRCQRGKALFSEGQITPFLEAKKQFAYEFEVESKRNKQLSALLMEMELLEPGQWAEGSSSKNGAVSGFLMVSREKMGSLSEGSLTRLRDSGALELIYQHLFSLDRFIDLSQKCLKNQIVASGA